MIIEELKFRRLCKGEYGGFEGQKFQDALTAHPELDPVPVVFETAVLEGNEMPTYHIPRAEAEQYAQWAREERKPEEDLLERIKPDMRGWIRLNRSLMCKRIRKALEIFNPEHHTQVTIVWEIETPDKVDVEIVRKYLKAYE